MELIFNELSFEPLADSDQEVIKRFDVLFKTFKTAKEKIGFETIKFHSNYGEQNVTADKKFYGWIRTVSNSNLRNRILSFFRHPFSDDLNDKDLETFMESNYIVDHDDVPTQKSPLGLPIAHIKSTITMSFNSHPFWKTRKINIQKINTSKTEETRLTAYNICLETDLEEHEMIEWTDNVWPNTIKTDKEVIKYLAYSKYSVKLADSFMTELIDWKEKNIKLFRRIIRLMKDVEEYHFTGGMGQTENLKSRGKEASKRITKADRLSYILKNDKVTFIACKGHYKFH